MDDNKKTNEFPLTMRDPKTGIELEGRERGDCRNCGGSGACGKDRTGDDFACPRCEGSGKIYQWRPKASVKKD